MTAIYYLTIFFFLFIAALLCGAILIQESKSSGLGASFGGDTSDSVFGTATAEVLKRFTTYLAVLFITCCVMLSFWTSALGRSKMLPPSTQIERSQ